MITDQQVAESLKETQALHEHFRKVYSRTEVDSHPCETGHKRRSLPATCLSCGEQGLACDVWDEEDKKVHFYAILCAYCGSITREGDSFYPLNEEYVCDEGVCYWEPLQGLTD